ncbi:hypothetical protein BDZ89DRAFT_1040957 [Hymenopellis radicata]|nr:hypothetical protein BDZ89DRAFT_1040957 [Hymenopellis radicata]
MTNGDKCGGDDPNLLTWKSTNDHDGRRGAMCRPRTPPRMYHDRRIFVSAFGTVVQSREGKTSRWSGFLFDGCLMNLLITGIFLRLRDPLSAMEVAADGRMCDAGGQANVLAREVSSTPFVADGAEMFKLSA